MRIALIILSILALIFIGSISWSLVNQEGWKVRLPSIPTTSNTSTAWANDDNIALETWKNQMKTDEKLEKLTNMVQELAKKNGTLSQEDAVIAATKAEIQEAPAVKPSGKFLALIMPTITPVLDKNAGIFGLYIFDLNVRYSTYKDNNYALTIIPTDVPYDTFLKNLKALGGKPFSVKETQTFAYRSFYINPEVSDSTVRLVIEVENQTLAIEIAKSKFDVLKSLLSWKQPTSTMLAGTGGIATKKTPTVIVPQTKIETPTTKSGSAR